MHLAGRHWPHTDSMTEKDPRPGAWQHGTSDPLTPQGQIEQWGRIAHGLKHNHPGRARALRMLAWLVALIAAAVVLVVFLG